MSSPTYRAMQIIRSWGEPTGRELRIGGVSVSEIVRRVSTPCYVYSGDVLMRGITQVLNALGPETQLFYSLKANPSLGLCQMMARAGLGAEVASSGELALARAAGFPVARTLFAGPGKTNEELRQAASAGIRAINVESAGEMERLSSIAAELGAPVRAAIRVNPLAQVRGAQMRMGGGSQQFGVDEEQLPDVLSRFATHPNVQIVGLHVYAGTQIFDVEALLAGHHHAVDLALQTADRLKRPLEMLDLGGGFGVPYFDNQKRFDLNALAQGYREVVRRCKEDPRLAPTQLVIELGRYLVAEAGVYLCRVVDVKRSRGKTFVVTDGGMNHHITATGNFGQVFRKPYPMAVVTRLDEPEESEVSVVGPCCTPLDVFAHGVPLPRVDEGDIIGVFSSGAYGYSASSIAFLSHPTPAEVLTWQGNVHVLRPAGRPEQFLQEQVPLPEGNDQPRKDLNALPVGADDPP